MDQEQRIKELEQQVTVLTEGLKKLSASSTIPFDTCEAFRSRLLGKLKLAPLALITAPSGGATSDSQARTAINSIITALETLGLVNPN